MRLHSIDRFAPEQEPVETASTPTVLEILGRHVFDAARRVVADVADGEIQRSAGLRGIRGRD